MSIARALADWAHALALGLSPERPATAAELTAKFADCGADVPQLLEHTTWDDAPGLLRTHPPAPAEEAM